MTQRAAVRGRRALAALALSVVAVGVLSACQEQPGTAAYVGGTRITTNAVDKSVQGILGACETAKASASPEALADPVALSPACAPPADQLRALAVRDKVTIAVASRYGSEHGITATPVDPQQAANVAAQLGVGPSDPFVTDYMTAQAWVNALISRATPVTPTDAELRGIYQAAKDAGVTSDTYQQDKAAIAQVSGVGQAIAVQRELTAAANSYGVAVSPRYQPSAQVGTPARALQIPLLQLQGPSGPITVLSVDLGQTASPAVVSEPSAPAATPSPTGQNAP